MSASEHRKDVKDIAKGASVNLIGVIVRSFNFIFYLLLARLYGADATGLYLLGWSTVDISSKLGILGLDRSMLKFVAEAQTAKDDAAMYRHIAHALQLGIMFALIVTVILELLAPVITVRMLDRPELLPIFRLMAPGVIFWTISAILLFAIRGVRIMRYEILAKSLVEPLTLIVVSTGLYLLDFGNISLGIAYICATFGSALAAVIFFARVFDLRQLFKAMADGEGRMSLLSFSYAIGLYDMFNLLLQRIDIFLVSRFLDAASVGVYGIAQEVVSMVKKVRQAFDPIFVPVVSGARQRGSHDDVLSHYRSVTRWILTADAAVLGVFALASHEILSMFGPDFANPDAAMVLILLSVAVVINSVCGVSELFILITRPLINLMNTLGTIVLTFGLGYVGVRSWGAPGAAGAIVLSFAAMNIARLVEVGVMFRMQPFGPRHGYVMVAFGVSLLAGYAVRWLALPHMPLGAGVAGAVVFVLLFAPFAYRLGLAKNERAFIARMLGKLKNGNNIPPSMTQKNTDDTSPGNPRPKKESMLS